MRIAAIFLVTTLLSSLDLGRGTNRRRRLKEESLQRLLRLFEREDEKNDPLMAEAKEYLAEYNEEATKLSRISELLQFNFLTNETDENSKKIQEFSVTQSAFEVEQKFKALEYFKLPPSLPNQDAPFPQLEHISNTAVANDPEFVREQSQLSSQLESIYAKAEVCEPSGDQCFHLEPDLVNAMSKSHDYDRLLWAWKGWHDATGPKMKPLYVRLVEMMNENERNNGYADESELWMKANDETNPAGFEQLVGTLLEEMMPLYKQLHAYLRGRLSEFYGSDRVDPNELIPVHLLGVLWAEDWSPIDPVVNPYPNKLFQEAEEGMLKKKLEPLDLFKIAEEFYTSIGLFPMTDAFWKYSMITKPTDGRTVECHGAAHDMGTGDDFRIQMCTEISMLDFYVVHHEMGHIEYYMAYANQTYGFRNGAHDGFHEAIGDTIGLSVVTPKHLATIGLVDSVEDSDENSISFLLSMALQKVAFLPFAYTIDKWRWRVFRGDIKPDDYTTSWWDLHRTIQGVAPPVPRDDPDLFDPGALYHIPAGVPYIRYFISFLLQFHFHEALCAAAGHEGPVHKCDIYRSKDAGEKFLTMLRMGSSRPWPDALEVLTGSRVFSTGPLLRYFEPLRLWLIEQNRKNKYPVGW